MLEDLSKLSEREHQSLHHPIPEELLKQDMNFDHSSPHEIRGYQRRILTGMRPSGSLHLGHYAGALKNWLEMEDRFHCTFLIADLHAFADNSDRPQFVRDCTMEVALDWLAVGLDPHKADFVVQTGVPELENLTVLFETLVPLSDLQGNPTLKAELATLKDSRRTVSFHNYPVSEAADILGPRGDVVPAGDDQRPMIELTRRIARKVNDQFLAGKNFKLPLPQIYTGAVGRLRGTDGKSKMGKSLHNTIELNLPSKELKKRVNGLSSPVKPMEEPGIIEGHLVFEYLDAFHPDSAELATLKADYQKGGIGEGHLKQMLYRDLDQLLEPIRERRKTFESNPDYVRDVLHQGTKNVRSIVQATLGEVREAMGFFR